MLTALPNTDKVDAKRLGINLQTFTNPATKPNHHTVSWNKNISSKSAVHNCNCLRVKPLESSITGRSKTSMADKQAHSDVWEADTSPKKTFNHKVRATTHQMVSVTLSAMRKCFFSPASWQPDSSEVNINHVLVSVCYNRSSPGL